MNYRIKASDVAAIIGLNPYKTREDVMNEYFKTPTKRDNEFKKALAKETQEVQQQIKETLENSKTTDIQETPIVSTSDVIQDYVKHEVYKNNGTHRESRVAETHNVTRDSKWYSMYISEDVRLVGIIDGRRGDSIVEIKNRQRRLFGKVPTYEYVQCQVYMKLTGVRKCIFIESFGDVSKEYTLEFSDAFWELEILPSLRTFAHELIEAPFDDE